MSAWAPLERNEDNGAVASIVEALVVENAVFCGFCRPHPSPVRLDEILRADAK